MIPFDELPAVNETLHCLATEERPLIVLHGPYVTGKSSMLRFFGSQLSKSKTTALCLIDASQNSYQVNGGDMSVGQFWSLFGRRLFGNNDVRSGDDAVERLRGMYNGKSSIRSLSRLSQVH